MSHPAPARKRRRAAAATVQTALVCLAAGLALLTLATAYGGMIDPARWAFPSALAMTFPAVAAISLMALLAALLLKLRVCAAVLAGGLLLASPSLLDYSPLNWCRGPRGDEKERSFTVMTFNTVWWEQLIEKSAGRGWNASLRTVLQADPDILCTQENRGVAWALKEGATQAQVDSMLNRYPYREVATRYDGLTIYSKFPITRILEQEVMSNSAIYACYRISVQGRLLTLVNCHLQSLNLTEADKEVYTGLMRPGGQSASALKKMKGTVLEKVYAAMRERSEQGRALRRLIEKIPGNLIVCGDFNDVPGCHAIRTLKGADMRDAFRDAGLGPTPTFRTHHMPFRIDHILYRGDFKAIDSRRGGGASDHYPLMATFVWDKQPNDADAASNK